MHEGSLLTPLGWEMMECLALGLARVIESCISTIIDPLIEIVWTGAGEVGH
jgi:hypothetical protein